MTTTNPMQPAPMQPAPAPAPRRDPSLSVCAIIALVLGVMGVALSFIPIVNNFAAILGVVGVPLAVVGLVGTLRGRRRGKALAIVAAVLSVLAIVITLAMQAAFVKAIDDATSGSSTSSSGADAGADGSGDAKDDGSGDAKDAGASDVQDMEGDLDDLHVRIVSAVRSAADYNGQPTVLVTYEWTNTADTNTSFMVAADAQVFQNGAELDSAIYLDAPEGYDSGASLSELQPGATGTVAIGYVLADDSDVTVEVSDWLSLDGAAKVTHTFALQ